MSRLVLLFSCLMIVSGATLAQNDLPGLDSLDAGWNTMATDGVCSAGTPYQFYVKPSVDNSELLVFFNGGGACWFGQACDLNAQPNVHTPLADSDANNPAVADGIFDLDNPRNPFADYSMVFVSYCNGDVHIGSGPRDYSYRNADRVDVTVTTHHDGYRNSQDALQWVYENFPAPSKVVVSGSSAGAIGASFYAGLVAEHYPQTPVILLADGAGGYSSANLHRVFEAWNVSEILPAWPEYAGQTNQSLTFEDFYIASALHNANLTIAQYNSAEDDVQKNFTYLLGDAPSSFKLPERILNNYLQIESAVDQFYSYTAGGDFHTILGFPVFYQYAVEGISFVDWVDELIDGEVVADISCVNEIRGCSDAPASE